MDVIKWDGKPISKPGIYQNVPMSAYHGQLTVGPSISRSGLWKLFDKSPRHYFRESYLNPEREEQEESEALLLGRAAHHALLGEADFAKHFVIRPEVWDSWRTKDAKAWKAQQQQAGFDVLEPKHLDQIRGMAAGLNEDPLVRAGILNGLIEHTIVYQDPETKVWIKVRPDAIPTDAIDLADLKTAADISDEGIDNAIGRDGLYLQGALTGTAVRTVVGQPVNDFALVFVEKADPFCSRVKLLKPADLALGELTARVALDMFKRCLDSSQWPGPGGRSGDAGYAEMKPYQRAKIERRILIMQQELST